MALQGILSSFEYLRRQIFNGWHTDKARDVGRWSRVLHGQRYGPLLGTLNIRRRLIVATPKWDHNVEKLPHVC